MDYTYAIIDENAANGLHFQVQLQEFGEFSCAGIVGSPDEGLNFILKALPDLVIVNLGNRPAITCAWSSSCTNTFKKFRC